MNENMNENNYVNIPLKSSATNPDINEIIKIRRDAGAPLPITVSTSEDKIKHVRDTAFANAQAALSDAFKTEINDKSAVADEKEHVVSSSDEEIDTLIAELELGTNKKSKFNMWKCVKNISEKCKSYTCESYDYTLAPRFMKSAGIMKTDTKYIVVNEADGMVKQLNTDVPMIKIIFGKFSGDKYIKVK